MKQHLLPFCLLTAAVIVSGCGERASEPAVTAAPPKPKEAASQLDHAFAAASGEVQTVAMAASHALQTADYETAVQSLQLIREKGSLTVDQGMAVHNSMVSLETKLISAMASGDPNAKRAYDQLKRARKN